jgi:hypothetical protein
VIWKSGDPALTDEASSALLRRLEAIPNIGE